MRGFKSKEIAKEITDGFKIYYNFIRKHQELGKTPAEASGLELELNGNRWLSLLTKSMKDNQ